MKNLFKQKNGITLIALVITIIVLLILAGVTIAMLSGENGILSRAQGTRMYNDYFSAEEQVKLAHMAVKTEIMAKTASNGNYDARSEISNYVTLVRKDLSDTTKWTKVAEKGTDTIEITYTSASIKQGGIDGTIPKQNGKIDYTITLKEKDAILGLDEGNGGSGGESTPVSGIQIQEFSIAGTPVAEANIPVPTGFTHTTGTKDTGYVIQDGDGNEFVWVPVDKNQKITVRVASSEEIASLVLTDPYGDDTTLASGGTSYTNTAINPTINGPYRLVATTTSGATDKEIIYVHSLYAQDPFADFILTDEYAQLQGAESIEQLIESAFGSGTTLEDACFMLGAGKKSLEETENYATSVKNNGGFYIGRYEAGKVDNSLVIQNDKTVWNNVTQIDALSTAQAYDDNKTGITSSLLTGSAWDRTLGWLYETDNKTAFQIAGDSTSWGNYKDNDDTNNPAKTGGTAKAVSNNIYDLAGNVEEWTSEVENTVNKVIRGGYYAYKGSTLAAGCRNYDALSACDDFCGFRLALYL